MVLISNDLIVLLYNYAMEILIHFSNTFHQKGLTINMF